MAIPHQMDIANELLKLLGDSPNGTVRCEDAYVLLAKKYPELTVEEVDIPYKNSKSKWANSVQFARLYCVENGLILPRNAGAGHGFWTISDKGRKIVDNKLHIKHQQHLLKEK